MQDLNDKVTGGELTATEWNQVPSEIQNVIEGLGIALSGGDLNQLGKAVAGYVANSTFYLDSGIANAYSLGVVGSKQSPSAYTVGFEIRFIAGNENTGASTVNVASLGVKSLKLEGGIDLTSGLINSGDLVRAFFDGTDFIVQLFASKFSGSSVRNYVIDGRFDFWFEGVSQTSSGYGSDTMWLNENVGSTKVNSQIVASPGEISDVPTTEFYSSTNVASIVGAGNFVKKTQRIENVRTLAGKDVTISFYGKSGANQPVSVQVAQNFGSGGSPTVTDLGVKKFNLTTSFARFENVVSLPSILGKTIGADSFVEVTFWFDAGSNFDTSTDVLGQQSGVFDIANVQFEEGSSSTDFNEEDIAISLSKVSRYAVDFSGLIQMNTPSNSVASAERMGAYFPPTTWRVAPVVSNIAPASSQIPVASADNILFTFFGAVPNTLITVTGFFADARI